MAKIVFMSDSPTIPTGFGVVSSHLATAFARAGHEVEFIGWGYDGSEHNFPFNIIPSRGWDDCEDLLARYIRNKKPDILFTLGEPWALSYIPHLEERSAVAWVCYFPIDGYPIPPSWHLMIQNIDVPIVFSRFARELVKDVIGRYPILIPHGVDTTIFKPSDKAKAKKEVINVENTFIVGCVARNQSRKNLPALIKGFAKFAEKKDDAILYLHTQIRDVGWNLDELITRFGVQDKAYSTVDFRAMEGVSPDQLAQIYNMFDIMCLPSMSEGFGIPLLESHACGVPVLTTNFSANSEQAVDRQELLKIKDTLIMGRNIEQAIVDTDDIARKLGYFYNDWKRNNSKKLNEIGQKGLDRAKRTDWTIINTHFLDLMRKVEEKTEGIDKRIYPTFYKI